MKITVKRIKKLPKKIRHWFMIRWRHLQWDWEMSPLYTILNIIPGKRNKLITTLLFEISWYRADSESWKKDIIEQDEDAYVCADLMYISQVYALNCFIAKYNEVKYWFMPAILVSSKTKRV